MSPSLVVLLCLCASALAAPQLADVLTDAAIDVKQGVVVPVITVVSDVCPLVKAIVYPIETGGQDPDVDKMSVVFKHADGTNDTYKITDAAAEIPNSPYFDSSQKVYLYIPGFTDNPGKISFSTLSEALLSTGHTNVLALDASSLVGSLYLRSTEYASYIGEKLAEVLAAVLNYGVTASQMHVIGHSLGAQIAGFTGKQFYNKTGEKIGRITGLDPASPCFTSVGADLKLNKTDADFVDVIHTDGGLAGLVEPKTDAVFIDVIHTDGGVEGLVEPVGQVNFYPNTGANQPGCALNDSCSHHRAWRYYVESIKNDLAFPAVPCATWSDFKEGNCGTEIVYMGFPTQPGTTGLYALQTNGTLQYGTEIYSLGIQGTVYHDY